MNTVLDQVDTKELTPAQIQTAINDYLRQQEVNRYRREERRRDEARREAKRKITSERMSTRRLLEKGGIPIANADEYRSSNSSLDFMPSEGGFFQVHLNGGDWYLRRPNEETQARHADRKRHLIAKLFKIEGLEVKVETKANVQEWNGETKEYLTVRYFVRKAVSNA